MVKKNDIIDGQAVEERQAAMWQTPIMPNPLPCKTVDECLLTDGRVVYQCTMQDGVCDTAFWGLSVRSVVAHQAGHTKRERKAARQVAEELAARKASGSARAKKAAATRNANRAARTAESKLNPNTQIIATAATMTADEIASGLQSEATKLRGIAAQLDYISRRIPSESMNAATLSELDRLREIEKNYEAVKGLLR